MSVEVLNLAIPGVPSYVQAQTADDHVWTQLASCHVIIVDITVNDCPESDLLQDSLGTAYTSFVAEGGHMMKALLRLIFTDRNSTLPIGLLYFETFVKSAARCSSSSPIYTPEDARLVHGASSSFSLLTPRRRLGRTQIFSPAAPLVHPCHACPLDVAHFIHWPALVAYQIPVLAWPAVVCHADVALALCDDFPHPSSKYHGHMGKVVGFALYELLLEALAPQEGLQGKSAMERDTGTLPATSLQQARQAFQHEMSSIGVHNTLTNISAVEEKAWGLYTAEVVSQGLVEMAVLGDVRSEVVAAVDCERQELLTLMTARHPGKNFLSFIVIHIIHSNVLRT